ncbi:MAG: PKD-like domain-containing protein [Rikenellaceae bacterium]
MRGVFLLRLVSLWTMMVVAVSCSDEGSDVVDLLPPSITFTSSTNSYEVKLNRSITITPIYENVDGASYSWSRGGEVVSTAPELTFESSEVGDYYFDLDVVSGGGAAYAEVRISVLSLVIPTVDLSHLGESYSVVSGVEFSIVPTVTNGADATFAWMLDGDTIATTQSLSYTLTEVGQYQLSLAATSDDGCDVAETQLCVVDEGDLTFYWDFEQTQYNMASGREVRIKCWNIANDFGGDYVWSLQGEEVQRGSQTEYIFGESAEGEYSVVVAKYDGDGVEVATQAFVVNVCAREGAYRRSITSTSSADCNRVYEFMPAPGQFVNNGYSVTTMAEACVYAQERLAAEAYVSLGGFGGYIVVGFDHSVDNSGGYDLEILGNPMATSSEPGIVMVMQDENGDGLANDTWYELKGSETEYGCQISDYAITYHRPSDGSSASAQYYYVSNQGGSGVITKSWNFQDYWPAWGVEDRLRFYGTSLTPRSVEQSSGYWVNAPYDWGYVDNMSDVDMLSSSSEYINAPSGNHFKISHAVDYKGDAVQLDYIDFVKIYVAVSSQSGWLGEVSTEVLRVSDFNINKTLD